MTTTDSLNGLHERRQRALEEARAVVDRAHSERRADLTGEEETAYRRATEEVRSLDERIAALKRRADLDREDSMVRDAFGDLLPGNEHTIGGDTIERWFRSPGTGSHEVSFRSVRPHVSDRGRLEVRALLAGDGAGTNVVPESMLRRIYETLLDQGSVPWQLRVTRLTTTSGEDLKVPTFTEAGTAAIIPEAGTIVQDDPDLGHVTLKSFKYGHLVRVSSELVADAAFDLVPFVARHAGYALAAQYEPDFTVGTGSGEPQGVMSAGTGVSGAGTATVEGLIDLQHSVSPPYRRRAQWLMNDSTLAHYRKVRDGAGGTLGAWLLAPPSSPGEPEQMFGRPLVTAPHVASVGSAAKSVAFGDFSTYYVRDAGMRFERSSERYFDTDEVGFRTLWRLDGRYAVPDGVRTYQSTS